MYVKRKPDGFNLAFLDVMSCGLGAVILIFLLIKHDIQNGSVESETILSELESIQLELAELETRVESFNLQNSEVELLGDELENEGLRLSAALADVSNKTALQQESNDDMKSSIEEDSLKYAEDITSSQGQGEEEYLIGLNVSGARIVVLIDHSGSMVDERIVNIALFGVSSDQEKRQSPKWVIAKKTAEWIMNRVPDGSEMQFIAFSEEATIVGEQDWFGKGDLLAVDSVVEGLSGLVPDGPTNLHAAMDLLGKLGPQPTDIYLITDGLPTIGYESDYNRRCSPGDTITSTCRINLYNSAMADFKRKRGVTLNVILLPLEGDPEASSVYWGETSNSKGLMISPSPGWP